MISLNNNADVIFLRDNIIAIFSSLSKTNLT